MIDTHAAEQQAGKQTKSIKCVVWDLDYTLWDGVLLESEEVTLYEHVTEIIKTLDSRGIIQSIASKNDYQTALAKLQHLGLAEYFLYPQINWSAKSSAVKEIARSLNIGLDTLAFIDDQPFELAEVAHEIPEILCIDASMCDTLLARPEMMPHFLTEDSRNRRLMYLSDIERNTAEQSFTGPNEDFLQTLDMVFTIALASQDDLQRTEELTTRTHQLNTTGYTYSYEELNEFRLSDHYKLYIAGLDDKYGKYGKIGVALVECQEDVWTIKLLLMSCRVMSRGVGTIMMNFLMRLSRQAGVRLQAEFIPNEKNRMMLITYKFAGFKELERNGNLVIFEGDLARIQPFPAYVTVNCQESFDKIQPDSEEALALSERGKHDN
jgi:FkbH-like protein